MSFVEAIVCVVRVFSACVSTVLRLSPVPWVSRSRSPESADAFR